MTVKKSRAPVVLEQMVERKAIKSTCSKKTLKEISASDGFVIGLDEATRGCLEWQELLNSTSNYFFSGEKCDRPGPLGLSGSNRI